MNRYPYTDMHEMNLDWILLKVKEMIGQWDTTKNAWNELHEFVDTYFENLDVQQEINNKLDEMAEGGELLDLMKPYIDEKLPLAVADQIADVVALQISAVVAAQLPDVVSAQLPDIAATAAAAEVGDWLAAHVDPGTGYVIDDTLTVQGAAADAQETGLRAGVIQGVSSGSDLNDLTVKGFYILAYAGTFVNSPVVSDTDKFKYVEVFIYSSNVVQRYTIYKTSSGLCESYFRVYDGSNWGSWVKYASTSDLALIPAVGGASSGDDLDDIQDRGFYRLAYGGTFVNSPVLNEANKYKFLEVLHGGTQTYQIYTLYDYPNDNCEQYYRIYDGSEWKRWVKGFSTADFNALYDSVHDTISESFTVNSHSSQGANDGLKLRVMTYNVAQYNNDTATYIPDEKVFNFRRMLGEVNADFVCVQEDRGYIDSGNTKLTNAYLYRPIYPYNEGSGNCSIFSKIQKTSGGGVRLSGSRMLRYCIYTFGDVKLLLCSSHPIANYNSTGATSAESIAMRATEYQEIMEWCSGDETLPDYWTTEAVTAPTHTHVIVCMDANSLTATDKSNLVSLAADREYVLANGDFLGWIITHPNNSYAIDNIMTSSNVIFNRITSLNSEYANLYSDHVPLFADVTLLNS